MPSDFVLHLIVIAVSAGVTYGAIRSDIKAIHEKISDTKEKVGDVKVEAAEAHKRLDRHIENHG